MAAAAVAAAGAVAHIITASNSTRADRYGNISHAKNNFILQYYTLHS